MRMCGWGIRGCTFFLREVLFFYGKYFDLVGEEIADIFPKQMFGSLGIIPYGGIRGLGYFSWV